jgi:hypothetical protein
MPTYLGWNVVTIPADPASPASFEFALNSIASVNTNPFTGQQQVYDWNANFMEASVSLQTLTQTQATNWVNFLKALKGINGVFQFGATVCAAYPESLTNGTTPRYWRLKPGPSKWSVKLGSVYRIDFEIREAT